MKTCFLVFILMLSAQVSHAQWLPVNAPTAYQFTLLARKGDKAFVRSFDNHFYLSTDGAQTWADITAGYPGEYVQNIQRGVFKGDELFVATENAGVAVFTGSGWEIRNTGITNGLYTYGIDTDGNYLTVSSYNENTGNSRIYISSDDGLHWTLLQQSIPNYEPSWVNHLLFLTGLTGEPGYYSVDYGQTFTPFPGQSGTVFTNNNYGYVTEAIVASDSTLYITTATGLDTAFGLPPSDNVGSINLARAGNGRLYLAALVDTGDVFNYASKAFFSDDDGRNWSLAPNMPHEKYDFQTFQGTFLWSVGGKMLLTDNEKFYESVDNGETWEEISLPGMAGTVRSFMTNLSEKFLLTSDFGSGMYTLSTNQSTWQEANGNIQPIRDIPTQLAKTNQNWQANSFFGYCSDDLDNPVWSRCFPGLPEIMTNIGDTTIYRYGFNIWRSTDSGQNWQQLGELPPNSYSLFYLNQYQGNFYAGLSGAYAVSTDKGQTWTKHNINVPLGYLRDMFFTNNNWYASGQQSVYSSADNGLSWSLLKNFQSPVTAVQITGTYYLAGTNSNGLQRSANGTQWSAVPGMEDFQFLNSEGLIELGGAVFAAGSKGFYVSSNEGADWSDFNQGLPEGTIGSQILLDNEQLYAVTDQGIFKRPFSDVTVHVNEPTAPALEISPNPVVDNLHISSSAPQMDVQVINAQGQVIISAKKAGTTIDLNVGNLPAGAYQVRVSSEQGTTVRPFIKL